MHFPDRRNLLFCATHFFVLKYCMVSAYGVTQSFRLHELRSIYNYQKWSRHFPHPNNSGYMVSALVSQADAYPSSTLQQRQSTTVRIGQCRAGTDHRWLTVPQTKALDCCKRSRTPAADPCLTKLPANIPTYLDETSHNPTRASASKRRVRG